MPSLTDQEAESYSDAIADVLCWFRGFAAAHTMSEVRPDLPPGLDRLRELNIKLKKIVP